MKKLFLIAPIAIIIGNLYYQISLVNSGLFRNFLLQCLDTSAYFSKDNLFDNFTGENILSLAPQYNSISLVPIPENDLMAKVDRRVELLSIVFRLAGNYEFNMNNFKKYNDDIDNYFQSFKNHPVVLFAKELRETREVDFDAVMFMAIHLSQPPELKPLVDFSDSIPEKRWGKDNAIKFVDLLQRFYNETQCRKFFENHMELYNQSEKRFQAIVSSIDLGWYKSFYGGTPSGKFNLFIGLNNGGANYGPKVVFPSGKEELFSIIGTWKTDSLGMPVYDDTFLPFVIHEFNHSFINSLIDLHYKSLEAAATMIFEPVKQQMKNMAYGNKYTMLKESLVRAVVISYMRTHGKDSIATKKTIIQEQTAGFFWMDDLYSLLINYENNRNKYPSLNSYYQPIENYFNELSTQIQKKILEFDNSCVHVSKIEPIENHAFNINPSLYDIIVHFDKAVNPKKYSIIYGKGGKEHFPIVGNPQFSEDNKSIILKIQLKPDFDYSFVLTPAAFESIDGYPLVRYSVEFKTAK